MILVLALMLTSFALCHILSLIFNGILAGVDGPAELLLLLAWCGIVTATTLDEVAWSSITTIVWVVTIILTILVHVAQPFGIRVCLQS